MARSVLLVGELDRWFRVVLGWLRRVLLVALPLYIVAMVGGAFRMDPALGGFVSVVVAVGLAIYIPVRLFVTGRWWDLFHMAAALLDGVLAGSAEQGRHHGHW
jgi:hypothetical protein